MLFRSKKSRKGNNYEILLPKQFQNNKQTFFAFNEDGITAKSHKIKDGTIRFLAEDAEEFSGLLINGKQSLIIE